MSLYTYINRDFNTVFLNKAFPYLQCTLKFQLHFGTPCIITLQDPRSGNKPTAPLVTVKSEILGLLNQTADGLTITNAPRLVHLLRGERARRSSRTARGLADMFVSVLGIQDDTTLVRLVVVLLETFYYLII